VSLTALIASIPSPGSNAIHLGPLQLRAYGFMIALGVLAGVWLTGRRMEAKQVGTSEDMSAIALWAVPAGVVGSRIYHVITDWKSFRGDWGRAFKIWEGGLGIWGGVAAGVLVGLWAARRRGVDAASILGCAAPALPLSQAIGRWGNWWNQELFGKPTTLPWALRVSPSKVVELGYAPGTTFHPTFLYESLWNFGLCGVLLLIDRRFKPRPLRLFAMYVAGYTFVRFFIERLRIDFASKIAGLRVNEWVSGVVFFVAVAYLLLSRTSAGPYVARPASADGSAGSPQDDSALPGASHDETDGEPDDDGGDVLTAGEPLGDDELDEQHDDEPAGEEPGVDDDPDRDGERHDGR
jgi:prolipoprotein diacylglyceryl transferase